jgi:hypothetical protein
MLLTFALLLAQTITPAPKAIPPERHEAISRVQLRLLVAQHQLMLLRQRDTVKMSELLDAEKAVEKAVTEWKTFFEALRKEFNADGCALGIEKDWVCSSK